MYTVVENILVSSSMTDFKKKNKKWCVEFLIFKHQINGMKYSIYKSITVFLTSYHIKYLIP